MTPEATGSQTAESQGTLRGFLDERLGLDSVRYLAHKKRVPSHRHSLAYYLGGMALFLFVIQIVTGMLLTLYYKPSADQAFESVQMIMTDVHFGWLIRSIHSWGANLLIGVLFLHLASTFVMRAYRRPREFTWVTGVLLLFLFMFLGFSGYLLPWNELAFFATRVGTAIAGAVPVIGDGLLSFMRAGDAVTGDTLARFYGLHVAIVPLIVILLLGVHLYLVQKHGMSVPHSVIRAAGRERDVPSVPFVPHFLLRDCIGWCVALAILATLAALFPWELGEKADPFADTPPGIKPEWYFLFMFQALKKLPAHILGIEGEALAVVFFGLAAVLLMVVPFIDRSVEPGRARRVLNVIGILAVVFFIVMTVWAWLT